MSYDIAFLHTGDVHVPTFQNLVDKMNPSLRVHHEVDAALLNDAIAHGMSESLENRIRDAMSKAGSSGAPMVVCTCSTIGGVAELAELDNAAISMRIDRPMADTAVNRYKNILIVAAVESTLEPTLQLLKQSASNANVSPQITLKWVEDAWQHFESGNSDEYYNTIAAFIKNNVAGFDCVVLAQASMAPVAGLLQDSDIPVLASPEAGVRTAIDRLPT